MLTGSTSEQAHFADPPLQIGPASLGSDLVLGANLKVASFLSTHDNLCRQKRCRRKTPHRTAVFFIFTERNGAVHPFGQSRFEYQHTFDFFACFRPQLLVILQAGFQTSLPDDPANGLGNLTGVELAVGFVPGIGRAGGAAFVQVDAVPPPDKPPALGQHPVGGRLRRGGKGGGALRAFFVKQLWALPHPVDGGAEHGAALLILCCVEDRVGLVSSQAIREVCWIIPTD